jgi:hypothetical protein
MLNHILNNYELPPYENFYNLETKSLVKEIYEDDFIKFGYNPEELI